MIEAWQAAAASCGLRVMDASSRAGLWAWAGPLEVRIERIQRHRGHRARIQVVIPGPLDFIALRIHPVPLGPSSQEREIESGDGSFDARFSIAGPQQPALAMLDAETRRLLLRLSDECRLEISSGSLRAEMSEEEVPRILPLLLEVGKRLAPSMNDLPRSLAENVKRDPVTRTRLQNLLLLTRELPENPATREALRIACSDPGPEGDEVLLELAETQMEYAPGAQVASILERLSFERMAALLDLALERRRIRAARTFLELLGRRGAAAVGPLVKVLSREKDELAVAAAEALGNTGGMAVEPHLIQALGHENPGVQVAAVNALARIGSAAAVLPLQEVAERLWLDGALRLAARRAITEIQLRLPGSPGQMALAEVEVGQLSLAPADAGQLSLASDTAGQLSVAPEEAEPLPPSRS